MNTAPYLMIPPQSQYINQRIFCQICKQQKSIKFMAKLKINVIMKTLIVLSSFYINIYLKIQVYKDVSKNVKIILSMFKVIINFRMFTKMNQQQNLQKSRNICNHILRITQDEEDHGNLYLGALGSLCPEIISQNKISVVLTIMDSYMYNKKNVKERVQKFNIKEHKWVNLQDDDQADIAKHLQQCYQFIQKFLENHNVLVHCQAGVSRSATIVIYFVMKKLNLSLQLANKYVTSKRYVVSPNEGFWKSLKQKEEELRLSKQYAQNKIIDPKSQFQSEKYPQKFANHIICINNESNTQKGNLFLGQYSILKSHFLKSLKIRSVLSVVEESYYVRMKVKEIIEHEGIQNHLWINIKDDPHENLQHFFQDSFNFINENMEKGNVLVHCQAGVSRSASVVIAFLIKKFKVDFSEALNFVQSKRKVVNPNEGFKLSLIQYSQKVISK